MRKRPRFGIDDSPELPRLSRKPIVSAALERAEAMAAKRAAMNEAVRAAEARIDVRSPSQPRDADEYVKHAEAWIRGLRSPQGARERFAREQPLRDKLGVSLKATRLLQAALDGTLNRFQWS